MDADKKRRSLVINDEMMHRPHQGLLGESAQIGRTYILIIVKSEKNELKNSLRFVIEPEVSKS